MMMSSWWSAPIPARRHNNPLTTDNNDVSLDSIMLEVAETISAWNQSRDVHNMNLMDAPKLRLASRYVPATTLEAQNVTQVMEALYSSERFLDIQRRCRDHGYGKDEWDNEYFAKREASLNIAAPWSISSLFALNFW